MAFVEENVLELHDRDLERLLGSKYCTPILGSAFTVWKEEGPASRAERRALHDEVTKNWHHDNAQGMGQV